MILRVSNCNTEHIENESVRPKKHSHELSSSDNGLAAVGACRPTMVWLLTVAKRAIMRNPTGAMLLGLCAHMLWWSLTRFSFAWPAVVQPSPPPQRFFPRSSSVTDFPYGDMDGVMSLLADGREECIFVMYYAPWCGRSVAARAEFDKAAGYLEDEVRFVAVNCWYEKGTCRQRNNFIHFPVLYFYWIGMDGVRYNGAVTSDFMIQFVLLMLNPVQRLSNTVEFAKMVAQSDTCVMGYFNMSSSGRSTDKFHQFRYAAIRTIERDPKNVIPFGVITDKHTAASVGLSLSSSLILVRSLNNSVRFSRDLNFTSSAIVQFVFAYRQQPAVKWMLPTGLKSLSLSNELRRGPALIAFINAKPTSLINYPFTVLRSIALEYLNCNWALFDSISTMRVVVKQYRSLKRQCDHVDSHQNKRERLPFTKDCCSSIDSCDTCVHYHPEHPHSVSACRRFKVPPVAMQTVRHSCVHLTKSYNSAEFYSTCCGVHQRNSSASRVSSDRTLYEFREDEFVKNTSMRLLCKRWKLSAASLDDDAWDADHFHEPELTGLGCKTNSTLSFFAMDQSTSYGAAFLASVLGDDTDDVRLQNSTTAIILNLADQSLHVMLDPIDHKNLAQFLLNYTRNALPQFHRSVKPTSLSQDSCLKHSKQCIVEVTTKSFDSIVMNPKKDVMLLYYTPWCGFCKVFSHIYLSLARHFEPVDNIVFARINAAANDLPWHLKVDSYPTLIFFPAGDKSNSNVFPRNLPLTLSSLALFIHRSASSTFEMRVCRPACIRNNLNLTVTAVGRLIRRRRRAKFAIDLLQAQLRTQLNASYLKSVDPRVHLSAPVMVTAPSVTDCKQLIGDVSEPIPVPVGPDSNAPFKIDSYVNRDIRQCDSAEALTSPTDIPTVTSPERQEEDEWQTTCNASKILQVRDELFVLRRRLFRYEAQLEMVRNLYKILIPISQRPDGHVSRRHWLQFQRLRTRLFLKLSNYRDFMSGSDDGMIISR